MQCPHCGADVMPADRFCPRCRKDVDQPYAAPSKRPIALLVVAAVALVAVATLGFLAALVVPSLVHGRIGSNEASAIGDIRTVLSSEIAYQQANGGRYGTLDCLATPSSCIAGYTGSTFIDPATATSVKQGYRRTFTLGPDEKTYTFFAVPVTGGSGTRVFCGNETGRVCQAMAGTPDSAPETVCDASRCTPL